MTAGPEVKTASIKKDQRHTAGLTEGDSGEEVALWLLTSLCTSAKREVEVALLVLTVKQRYIFTTKFPFFKPPL